ncbi:cell division protein FtsW [Carboxydocella sporoproducens DSM 16521]|uniref:Probable peptidoglycan glycosyltransferase FtsW n=3 Tax=Carboxydocella TaxID=178898 RepID=A0A1T4M5J1_9FIRM|nr:MULTISPECIES: putative lipid II flippase FtsW [Carboxydocella]AVX21036.1 cell division protein FtsW [Carboxydocella thermautotrophica]AVX31456.1 cell division protein FtsW [Carboxydocella thermautotrophica]SJZ62269.1 cell division protein FtsW [Carboxydocella sporoproducens DSM 16521]
MYTRRRAPDFLLFLAVMSLLVFGLVMVFSSSSVTSYYRYEGDVFFFFKKQLLWACLGTITLLVMQNVDYWRWRRFTMPALFLAIVLLLLVLLPGVGKTVNGAQRWINLGFMSFQPSETIKLCMVLFSAHYLAAARQQLHSFTRGTLPLLGVLGLVCGLILLQPDLGTAVALAGTVYIMLYAAGVPYKQLVGLALSGLAAVALAIVLEPYRMRRFLAFLDPEADPMGSGYHIIQSLYAIGSGGFFGKGLGQSLQKYFYLPEQHTDFIFAIIGEELGFLGGALVIFLFMILVWRGLRVAITAPDAYASLLAAGLTSMVGLQAVVNIGVVTGSLPVTGITLPFISFGGTSLVFSMAGIGLLLNISRYTLDH